MTRPAVRSTRTSPASSPVPTRRVTGTGQPLTSTSPRVRATCSCAVRVKSSSSATGKREASTSPAQAQACGCTSTSMLAPRRAEYLVTGVHPARRYAMSRWTANDKTDRNTADLSVKKGGIQVRVRRRGAHRPRDLRGRARQARHPVPHEGLHPLSARHRRPHPTGRLGRREVILVPPACFRRPVSDRAPFIPISSWFWNRRRQSLILPRIDRASLRLGFDPRVFYGALPARHRDWEGINMPNRHVMSRRQALRLASTHRRNRTHDSLRTRECASAHQMQEGGDSWRLMSPCRVR